jgi:hypothetical protein
MGTVAYEVERLFDKAHELALAEVERRARKILKDHPTAKTFCMSMGSASFYDKAGEPMFIDDFKYLKYFYDFLEQFDDRLYLSGRALKLTSYNGPKTTDW